MSQILLDLRAERDRVEDAILALQDLMRSRRHLPGRTPALLTPPKPPRTGEQEVEAPVRRLSA